MNIIGKIIDHYSKAWHKVRLHRDGEIELYDGERWHAIGNVSDYKPL